jgi:hypothetical protein
VDRAVDTTEPSRAGRASALTGWAALVQLTLIEGARGSFLPGAAILLTVLTVLLPELALFSFGEERRMASELGQATLRLAAVLVALDAALRAARDRDRAALATFLARPLGPAGYATARFAGSVGLLALYLLTLSVARALTLKPPFDAPSALSVAAVRTLLEGGALIAAAGMAGALLRPAGAAAATLVVLALGHIAPLLDGALGALAGVAIPDLGAIGPPDGLRADGGAWTASLLALLPTVAYLCVAIATAGARELAASGERGGG